MRASVHGRKLGFAAALLAITAASNVSAALVDVTYSVTAAAFEDSNGDAPSGSTSSSISGTFRFAFDPTVITLQDGIVPSAVTGFDIQRSDGLLIDFDETNTAVRISSSSSGPTARRITFGGSVHGALEMVGLTDPGDFRVQFDISTNDFEVLQPVPVPFGFEFQTRFDPFYDSMSWSASLVSAVPEPKLYGLMLAGLGLLYLRRRRARAITSSGP